MKWGSICVHNDGSRSMGNSARERTESGPHSLLNGNKPIELAVRKG